MLADARISVLSGAELDGSRTGTADPVGAIVASELMAGAGEVAGRVLFSFFLALMGPLC